jgi:hypothetical protein
MNYSKPEVVELGNATSTILGSKSGPPDPSPAGTGAADCELED